MNLTDISESVLSFIKHRIVGASFVSIVLLTIALLVIIYNQDKTITVIIVGILWLVASYEYFIVAMQDKAKAHKRVQSVAMDGLNVSNNLMKALYADTSAAVGSVMDTTAKIEETAILATVAAKVAKETSLAFGSSVEEAQEDSHDAITEIIEESNQSEANKQVLHDSFAINRDKFQAIFNPRQVSVSQLHVVAPSDQRTERPKLSLALFDELTSKSSTLKKTSMNADVSTRTRPTLADELKLKSVSLKKTNRDLTSNDAYPRQTIPEPNRSNMSSQVSNSIDRIANRGRVNGYGENEDNDKEESEFE